jgi:hypothetical protein
VCNPSNFSNLGITIIEMIFKAILVPHMVANLQLSVIG